MEMPSVVDAARAIRSGELSSVELTTACLAAIEAGNAYGNVHTDDGVAPGNTGAGDFPGGEIRGQLDAHGPNH